MPHSNPLKTMAVPTGAPAPLALPLSKPTPLLASETVGPPWGSAPTHQRSRATCLAENPWGLCHVCSLSPQLGPHKPHRTEEGWRQAA